MKHSCQLHIPKRESSLLRKLPSIAVVVSIFLPTALIGALAGSHAAHAFHQVGRKLTGEEATCLRDAAKLMGNRGLQSDSNLTNLLMSKGIWRAARPDDIYMRGSENSNNTPFAYTLFEGKRPNAVVLAPRFFTDTTPTGRAALMIHELGHYRAYLKSAKSDEVDGYKPEYDTHVKLGLTEADGLVYFGMLDGVAEYVVPKYPVYKTYADVAGYMAN
jgi:hypothetical protein